MTSARPSVSNLVEDEVVTDRKSLQGVRASPQAEDGANSDVISVASIDISSVVQPVTLGASIAEGDDKAEQPSGFFQDEKRPASSASKKSSISGDEQAERSSGILNEEGQLERMKSYDSALDIGGKERKRCAGCQKLEMCLDAIPFPCGIRPLPCLRRKGYCNKIFEANRCCFFLGRKGIGFMSHLRKLVLLVCAFFTCMSIILRGLPAAALESDSHLLEGYPWAYGKYVCLKPDTCRDLDARVMIGLSSLLVISDSHNIRNSIEWGSEDCVDGLATLGAGSYCEICREASLGCAAVAFLSLATGLVNFFTDIQRMRARNDHNCIKNIAVMSNVLGAIQQLCAVSIFHGLCVAEFPREDADQNFRLELQMGSGGSLLASACALNVFGIVIHLLVPVPEARWRTYGEITESDPAQGEWPALTRDGTVTTFAGPVPDDAPSSSTVEGSGPGWENDGQMMTPAPRISAADLIRRASERVADILSIDNASRTSKSSMGSQGSRRSSRSSTSQKAKSLPSSVDAPASGVDGSA